MQVKLEIKSVKYFFFFFFQNKHVCFIVQSLKETVHPFFTYCEILDPSIIQDSKVQVQEGFRGLNKH